MHMHIPEPGYEKFAARSNHMGIERYRDGANRTNGAYTVILNDDGLAEIVPFVVEV